MARQATGSVEYRKPKEGPGKWWGRITLKDHMSWRTAVKTWGLVTKLFSDACESKVASLRVRADNPTTGVRGPDRGERKGKQWVYPSEASALLSCSEVPLRWRRLYCLALYLYVRPGELAALDWSDVNLEHGYVSIHQALDLRADKVKATKTGITRKVPIRPALRALLEAMKREGGSGRVIQHIHANKEAEHGMPPLEDLAATLRDHLLRAGVRRADLHEDRTTTKRITFYDLRASGITWEVLDGTEHVRIMQRAGHRSFSTTMIYVREAEAVGLNVGTPFPTLPKSLIEAESDSEESGGAGSESSKRFAQRHHTATQFSAKTARRRGVPNGIRIGARAPTTVTTARKYAKPCRPKIRQTPGPTVLAHPLPPRWATSLAHP